MKMVPLADFFNSREWNEGKGFLIMDLGMVARTKLLHSRDSPGGGLMILSLSMRKWGVRYSSLVGVDGCIE